MKNLKTPLAAILIAGLLMHIAPMAFSSQPYETLEGPTEDVEALVFNPEGTKLYAGGWDRKIYVYSWPEMELLNEFEAHHSAIFEIQFSKDGEYFMTASNDNNARLWETGEQEHINTFTEHDEPVKSAAISPENRFVITISEDQTMNVFDREEDFDLIETLDLEGEEGNTVTFEPTRGLIVKGTSGNVAKMVQPGTFSTAREFVHEGGVNDAYFIEDGTRIITGSDDQTAKVWDPVEGEEVSTLSGHTWRILSVHLDEEGEYAVTSSNDGSARLWDANTGDELNTFELDRQSVVRSAVLSPDLEYVISSAQIRQPDHSGIKIWESGIELEGEEEEEENGEEQEEGEATEEEEQ